MKKTVFKLLSLCLSLVMMLAMSACGNTENKETTTYDESQVIIEHDTYESDFEDSYHVEEMSEEELQALEELEALESVDDFEESEEVVIVENETLDSTVVE
jgi:hypothetical protein